MAEPQVDPSLQQQQAPPVVAPQGGGAAPQQQSGGVQKLQYLMGQSSVPPTPKTVAFLIQQNPGDRDAMLGILQQSYGNGYTQDVVTAAQQPIAPSDGVSGSGAGEPGSGIKGAAIPKVEVKDPGAKLSSDLSTDEAKTIDQASLKASPTTNVTDDVPPPPAWVYNDGDKRDGAQRAAAAQMKNDAAPADQHSYVGTSIPVQPGPGQVAPVADRGTTKDDGTRTTYSIGTQRQDNQLGNMSSMTASLKTVATDDQSPEAKAAAFTKYKAAAGAALDEQIKALDTNDPKQVIAKVTRDNLVAEKEKLDAATTAEQVDQIRARNNLLVAPADDQRSVASVTRTSGVNAGGIMDGSAVAAKNEKTVTQDATPGGDTTTKTTDKTRELSTKGLNLSNGSSTTVQHADGTTDSTSSKTALTGGITDPLALTKTKTTATPDGAQTTTKKGLQAGDGLAGVTGGVQRTNADGSGMSASGKFGAVSDDKGTGAKLSVDDARTDLGGKDVAAGVFLSADGTMQMLVTPTDDGGCTITLTVVARGKAGAYMASRDPKDPVTTGNTGSAGGDMYGGASKTITRSKRLTAAEAKAAIGDLDSLATSNVGGKRTFGADASAHAYSAIFGGKLADIYNGEVNGAGESTSDINEKSFGLDGKAGASTGDGANARSGFGIGGGYETTSIDGHTEAATDKDITRSVVYGGRDGYTIDGSVSEGAAGGSYGVNSSNQKTRTYVFTVPKSDPDAIAKLRTVKSEQDAKDFRDAHPAYFKGIVEGTVDSSGDKTSASAGPLAVTGKTQSTETGNVAKGQHTEVGPDGKPVVKHDLSGTQDGQRKDDASVSLLGVNLAQGSSTVASHGAVDSDGQSSLDVTQTDAESNIGQNVPKGVADMKQKGKADVALAVATNGPWGMVKKLADRVGEQNTVGAHLDDAAFNQLLGVAASDQKRWNDSILVDYRTEWFTLRSELNNPNPPADWIAQDDSEGHIAAKQLARMKSIAHFVAVSGPAGQQAMMHVRGEYGADAIGQTVSWPPSLQGEKAGFDDLAKQVEHLKATLTSFANAGDAAGGKALLDSLQTKLGGLRQKILDAPDHADPTLGQRAANGVGDMQAKVTTWGKKFDAAITAFQNKGDVAKAFDDEPSKATALWHAQDDDAKQIADAKAATAKLETSGPAKAPGAVHATEKQWAEFDKQHAAAMADEQKAEEKKQADHDAETKARADEAKTKAESMIPDMEARCLQAKGKAWGMLGSAAGAAPQHFYNSEDTTASKLNELGTFMHQWQQDWATLNGYYKDAGKPDGWRADLKPALVKAQLQAIADNTNITDANRDYARSLRNDWGTV
ncbi:MAG TPA: hypothetical protein VGM88_08300 [Kofleriaceae bacterium]|jgi:hypothetical protein